MNRCEDASHSKGLRAKRNERTCSVSRKLLEYVCTLHRFFGVGPLASTNNQRSVDTTTNGMVIGIHILCVAPSAGLVMTRSSIPVSRAIARVSAVVVNV